jgi:hypothetical protein
MADPVAFKLRVPVVFAGKTIDEMVMQPMRPAHLRNISKDASAEDKALLLVQRLSGQPPGVIDLMDMADFEEAAGIIAGFQSGSQATGRT